MLSFYLWLSRPKPLIVARTMILITVLIDWRVETRATRSQKSSRSGNWLVRLPSFSVVCTEVRIPNMLGLLTFIAGGAEIS
jgi:hypothetical protein